MEPARSIKELIAWQLGSELSDVVAQMVGKTHSHQNPKLCEQLRASSDSVPANLAEGFGRYYPRENARFVRIAKASLTETQNHLQAGNRRDYWTAADFEKAWRLSCRAMKAIVGYLRYLEGCHGELPAPKPGKPRTGNQ